MDRRTFLSLCAGAPLTGCLGTGRQPRTRIAWIRVVNSRDERHDVDVFIERDDQRVFFETYQLAPATGEVREEEPVAGSGRYIVRARMDGQIVRADIAESVDGDSNCIGIRFSLQERDTLGTRTRLLREC